MASSRTDSRRSAVARRSRRRACLVCSSVRARSTSSALTRTAQFRDIRPKAASGVADISEASALLGHSKEWITERIYRRIGAVAKPAK
ncbi:hypothetical protein EQV90_14760 [Pseudomonas sp. TMW22089]|nr:hypothetical protein [Pseudomonas sp. TMW22089]